MTYLEHVNITVPDVQEAVRFLLLVDPDFVVRHDGIGDDGCRWLHIGDDNHYFALRDVPADRANERVHKDMYHVGFNHFGIVVDDIAAVRARLLAAGCTELTPVEDHPHRRRAYFLDSVGFEWEFVEYLSADPSKRNAYDLD